ncbi:hypothetical protein HN014_10755 [Aquimarina sp. TRL1]|uniref:hypothetical protein n=1 Tax=Aquimarina sp. (strain TRL1) TaxID=2736252 RepID=UPI00158E238C|nr:hypothetical protein [Aquimarina sp. TRL1]QKX05373.1 hypothetical protein HN014_10755 [Aquimarina sp. TRL1]
MNTQKHTKQVFWMATVITGATLLYYLLQRKKNKDDTPDTITPSILRPIATEVKQQTQTSVKHKQPQVEQLPIPQQSVFPLKPGSKGKEVERLQIWLLRNHGWKGEITRIYDDQTLKLVRKSLKKDQVDKHTYQKKKMGIPICQQFQP